MSWPQRCCEACGDYGKLTKHHIYPKSLKDVWKGQVKQEIAHLCRTCHDVVHLPGGLGYVRDRAREDDRWQAYKDRISDPSIQKILGPYRHIIRHLERHCRALHAGEVFDTFQM